MIKSIKNKLLYIICFLPFSNYVRTFERYKKYTMIGKNSYVKNLLVAEKAKNIEGSIVECGVWRGGMIAGLTTVFGKNRNYYLFDSFEGLPKAMSIDGERAISWQNQETDIPYFDNCAAEISYAEEAMGKTGVKNINIVKGWFKDTLPIFDKNEKIAVLRMDGDWYESTIQTLENLYTNVSTGGIIIIDDYQAWEGCSRAIHDFLSKNSLPDRIFQFENEIFYIKKS